MVLTSLRTGPWSVRKKIDAGDTGAAERVEHPQRRADHAEKYRRVGHRP
jgi:hypothetical protein